MFYETVTLPPGRIEDSGFNAVYTGNDIEAVDVGEAIEPVGDVKRSIWSIVDLVGARPTAKEGAGSPRGNTASDGELDRAAMLVKVGKLQSHVSKRAIM